jgi:Fic family protein
VYEVAGRRAWILTETRPTDGRALFLSNYWPVVALVLAHYAPAVIVGLDAVRVHLGDFAPPRVIAVRHAASASAYLLTLDAEFQLRLRPGSVAASRVAHLDGPNGSTLPVLAPPDLLLTLSETELAGGIEPISAWLRHLALREADLREAAEESPRPVVLQRLADLAGGLGNRPLQRQLDAAARAVSAYVTPPARTGVGSRIIVPRALAASRSGAGSPWVDAQAMRLDRQEREVSELIGSEAAALPTFPIRLLAAKARQAKTFDAYHSTTMEGYRISPDVAEAIVKGDPLPDGLTDARSREAAMAVQGYSKAFDDVLDLAAARTPITAGVILDLYEALYRPSVEAGIVAPHDLRRWRNGPVALLGWRHVPPNYKKIDDLMAGLERFAARPDLAPIARALLVHLEFVTVHPFYDGNGRLGRLLMNLALLSAGHPWVTIRADERIPFFRSIESAQVEDNTAPFIEFLWHQIRRATTDATPPTSTNKRRTKAS